MYKPRSLGATTVAQDWIKGKTHAELVAEDQAAMGIRPPEDSEVTVLEMSDRDKKAILDAIANPPEPNEALRKAFAPLRAQKAFAHDPRLQKAQKVVRDAIFGSKAAKLAQKQLDTGKDMAYWLNFVDELAEMEPMEATAELKAVVGTSRLPGGVRLNRQKFAEWLMFEAKER